MIIILRAAELAAAGNSARDEATFEKNGCLAVKPKSIKLTYAEMVRLKDSVEAQNRLIAKGGDPTTNDSILNVLSTNDQVKVDIKTK